MMTKSKTIVSNTPRPPYYSVILTVAPGEDLSGYHEMTEEIIQAASEQEGFLGIESAEDELGIIVSYWDSLASIEAWSRNAFHQFAKSKGKSIWYQKFRTRICKVEHEY
ncbi:Heme-degrading monooxygenase HmoA [Alicyclobacillus tolerans]|uniref:Heme-degrading monooxygenase HmoA n=2 Tax=Alicyclobacillus tolerans TaxID=90970 RepID=A0A1M6MSB6_9BACL|nr:Heme-degrading monooxygenase HmoA [Alicyclobacillus montanus]